MMTNIVVFIIGAVLSLVFMPLLKDMLSKTSLLSKNYKNEDIPNGMGLGIIFAQVLTLGLAKWIFKVDENLLNNYLFGFVFIGLLGLLDDTIGTDEYKGFKGHIGAFFKGKLTTGNIKASLGFFVALYVSSNLAVNLVEIFINAFLIALFTNLMNLFDLRPGRAIKVFYILATIIIITSAFKLYDAYIVFSICGILLAYFKIDLRALGMMGDTGSNVLGFTLGYYTVSNFNIYGKMVVIILLVLTNMLSEKKSFSKIIEENKILNYIDKLGR